MSSKTQSPHSRRFQRFHRRHEVLDLEPRPWEGDQLCGPDFGMFLWAAAPCRPWAGPYCCPSGLHLLGVGESSSGARLNKWRRWLRWLWWAAALPRQLPSSRWQALWLKKKTVAEFIRILLNTRAEKYNSISITLRNTETYILFGYYATKSTTTA